MLDLQCHGCQVSVEHHRRFVKHFCKPALFTVGTRQYVLKVETVACSEYDPSMFCSRVKALLQQPKCQNDTAECTDTPGEF